MDRGEKERRLPFRGAVTNDVAGTLNVFRLSMDLDDLFALARMGDQEEAGGEARERTVARVTYERRDHPWRSNPASSRRFHTKIIFIASPTCAGRGTPSPRLHLYGGPGRGLFSLPRLLALLIRGLSPRSVMAAPE